MKILLLTPQLPYPPQQGTTIRNFSILRGLSPRHEIDLLSFGSANELNSSPLIKMCRQVATVPFQARSFLRRAIDLVTSDLPDLARRLSSPELARRLSDLMQQTSYDVVQAEGIEMAGYFSTAKNGARFVFDDHNAEYVLQRTAFESDRRQVGRWHAALYSRIQYGRLARYERAVCLRADCVAAVSRQDADALISLDSRIRPLVIPNGVDLEYYSPVGAPEGQPDGDCSLVFTGKMDFRPNVDAATWFCDDILPAVRRLVPDARICFVGQKPSAQVLRLARLPGVEVTGWVADTRPFVAAATACIVPLRMGGGTRLKVLEAMAMGKAIVSTRLGIEGIECVPGRDLLAGDTPSEFAQAVAELARDPGKRRELGLNARRLVENSYDWSKIVPKFEELYEAFDSTRTDVL